MIKLKMITLLLALIGIFNLSFISQKTEKAPILSYTLDPAKQELALYWKDTNGNNYRNFKNLKSALSWENKTLLFATNGGMFLQDRSPQGLYIEKGKTLKKLNTVNHAYGNFYLQPNGVFYLTDDNKAAVCKRTDFKDQGHICYATQSGPMLVIDGNIHPKFTPGSANVHIRNGVGILPDGKILFAMSKETINLYDFARFFKEKGCENALYLDGFVSRTYLPEQNWEQVDGDFGVMIGVTTASE
jgi:uncharacterized protein YigE (DUF2233 family)